MTRNIQDDDEDGASGASEFARMLDEFDRSRESGMPAIGSQVQGRIVMIGEATSFVDFGGRSEGVVESVHLLKPDGSQAVQVGDTITLFVVDNREQVILAPSVRMDNTVAPAQLEHAFRAGLPVSGRVSGQNAGGLEVELSGLRGFCPFSQVEAGFCADPSIYVGRTLDFLVTELSGGGKRLVVSRKALLRREAEVRLQELMATLQPGAECEGKISRLETFGAFVDLGGVDGLIHVSEISHARMANPADVLSVGQPVRVKVLSIGPVEKGRQRISLSLKATAPDPWSTVDERFREGDRVTGKVARLADFGAFVNLAPGIDGLVHVSEIAERRLAHPRDALAVGQEVEAVVRAVDRERRRISLSIKDAMTSPAEGPVPPASKQPEVGDLVEGRVAGIKPYGLFVDLPVYGSRTRGLVPHEETGEPARADLNRRFHPGDELRVQIIAIDSDGRIRLSLTSAARRAEEDAVRSYQEQRSAPSTQEHTAFAEAMRRAMEKKQDRP